MALPTCEGCFGRYWRTSASSAEQLLSLSKEESRVSHVRMALVDTASWQIV